MEANSKREDIIKLITSMAKNPGNVVDADELKTAISKLSASVDLVR